MHAAPPVLAAVPTPEFLTADDGDWRYYLGGHDTGKLVAIDDPERLIWETLWMRPERVSSVAPEDRGEGWDALTRDLDGRFAPAYCWLECTATHPEARPFLGVRYKP